MMDIGDEIHEFYVLELRIDIGKISLQSHVLKSQTRFSNLIISHRSDVREITIMIISFPEQFSNDRRK